MRFNENFQNDSLNSELVQVGIDNLTDEFRGMLQMNWHGFDLTVKTYIRSHAKLSLTYLKFCGYAHTGLSYWGNRFWPENHNPLILNNNYRIWCGITSYPIFRMTKKWMALWSCRPNFFYWHCIKNVFRKKNIFFAGSWSDFHSLNASDTHRHQTNLLTRPQFRFSCRCDLLPSANIYTLLVSSQNVMVK
jgi:hypothetical protein